MRIKTITTLLCLLFTLFSTATASEINFRITNVAGGRFTVSWRSESKCIGKLDIYNMGNKFINSFIDDRGEQFFDIIHYITVDGLKDNTSYQFSIKSDKKIFDNDGYYFSVTTGPTLVPMGSIQPAGKILLSNKGTPASGSIVYITISNSNEKSALLSTLVDNNGYWYIDLINARTFDDQNLYKISSQDELDILVLGTKGNAKYKGQIYDNQGGKKLYPNIYIK